MRKNDYSRAAMDMYGDTMYFDNLGRPCRRPSIDDDLTRCDPVRTPQTHPYNYDPFTIWGGPNPSANGSEWTDRLQQWDYSKYKALSEKHFSNGSRPFSSHGCQGELIQAFLRDFLDKPTLILTRVIEYCNQSSGYPLWCMVYVVDKSK